ncbi:23S rRNA (uridine(2552)-2'-O)-methyltransferase RlmE [Brumicola pallidula]|jgi:23S rRNA (uridine2552-2'-O)-methyltransferase|uniref:Ribosomal RNA large subunit methyltransferase E n=1 Tax=Brumicola pallidula DSM 14239 = ACAM 615 TaxID=1121922 RepID=K6ZL18_9ALTE|nr:23S rRNA (uridine(2552)-2'-O)-methyltransferase RlmE [Glaciecola pallidula]GAC29583.1 ribosomal RNA large subunit methyltransferase E [Glaciecola pallidula DSM 14239 = ACAM 615]
MARSKTSKQWMDEHVNDPYVKKAKIDGYRSRASYKIIEINEKDKIIRAGNIVMDLGSAPGGWSQVVAPLVGASGRVIASDILPMDGIIGVTFIQGDFTEAAVYDNILSTLNGDKVDVVVSDMSPNLSGVNTTDQYSSIYLVELALDMARNVLKPGGSFCAKVFQGVGYEEYAKEVRKSFDKVVVRKPDASRARSREVYIVGKGFKG